jgi:hypothetical protein
MAKGSRGSYLPFGSRDPARESVAMAAVEAGMIPNVDESRYRISFCFAPSSCSRQTF